MDVDAVELKTLDDFEVQKGETHVMFVFAPTADQEGEDAAAWKTVFSQVARANRFDGKFYTAESDGAGPAIANALGGGGAGAGGGGGGGGSAAASPVAVVKGSEVVYYKGKPLLPLLKTWMWNARHPKVAEMTHKLAASTLMASLCVSGPYRMPKIHMNNVVFRAS